MMRKSDYFDQVDRYLDADMSPIELKEFGIQLENDLDLAEELDLHLEVDRAIVEFDLISLRENLNQIIHRCAEDGDSSSADSFSFGLSDEFSSYLNLDHVVDTNELQKIEHSFPKIHLYQHHVAGRENIHQFYKEQIASESGNSEESFTSYEEDLFADIQNALEEKDVFDIRANLRQIAQNMPLHQYSAEDIDSFIYDQMESEDRVLFEEELTLNASLASDVQLIREIDLALSERGVMDLRATLNEIQRSEFQSSSRIEEMEGYIYNELSDEEMALFEAELSANQDLLSEIDLIRNVDQALMESDVVQLRHKLQEISGEIASRKRTERSFVARIKVRKMVLSSVAASLILLLGLTGILSSRSSEGELYEKFYSAYQTTGIARSSGVSSNQSLTLALQKFDSQDYEAALRLLQDVVSRDDDNMVGHFYSGVSFQETGKYQNAIREYETVIIDKDNLFVEQANWYIGLCYLQTNENKKAYRQFKKIAQHDGFYQLKAQAILRKMKSTE
jgi:predicted transcriptional regulator YheO